MGNPNMNLGFIGVGNMGGAMCRNLISDGHRLVVCDTDPQAVERCTTRGAEAAATPGAVAGQAEIVFTSLPKPTDVEQVVWGDGGLHEASREGLILVEMSTNLPSFARDLAARLTERGMAVLDVPIMGSPAQVENRETSVVVGGDAQVFARVEPLLGACFRNVFHVGGHGAGLTVKLINNLLNYCNLGIAKEVLSLAAGAGIVPELLFPVLQTRGWDEPFWKYVAEKVEQGGYDSSHTMDLTLFKTSSSGLTGKSLAMALEMGDELDVPLQFGNLLIKLMRQAKSNAPAETS
ncbi:MAG: NAD(P)-dependent oxidoreductase [SAR324 cluster bacterium]|nr:NAD(P)-dependent oxidoreductase [SAR324 cluster bacterium]